MSDLSGRPWGKPPPELGLEALCRALFHARDCSSLGPAPLTAFPYPAQGCGSLPRSYEALGQVSWSWRLERGGGGGGGSNSYLKTTCVTWRTQCATAFYGVCVAANLAASHPATRSCSCSPVILARPPHVTLHSLHRHLSCGVRMRLRVLELRVAGSSHSSGAGPCSSQELSHDWLYCSPYLRSVSVLLAALLPPRFFIMKPRPLPIFSCRRKRPAPSKAPLTAWIAMPIGCCSYLGHARGPVLLV